MVPVPSKKVPWKQRFVNVTVGLKAVIAVKNIAPTIATTTVRAPMRRALATLWRPMLFLKDNHGPDPDALKKRANLTIAPTTVNAKTMALACVTRAVQVLVVKSTPAPKHATTVATATAMASASVPWDGRVNRAVKVFAPRTTTTPVPDTGNAKKNKWAKAWCIATANATLGSKAKVAATRPARPTVEHLLKTTSRVAPTVAMKKVNAWVANAIAILVSPVDLVCAKPAPTNAATMDVATQVPANATTTSRVLPATPSVAHWTVPTMAFVPLILLAIVPKVFRARVAPTSLVQPTVPVTVCAWTALASVTKDTQVWVVKSVFAPTNVRTTANAKKPPSMLLHANAILVLKI
jgi:hypothetical protein